MRKTTVRYGLKLILAGLLAVTAGTFFHSEIAGLLLLGPGGEAQVTFLGFFLGWLAGGCGVLVAAGGLLQSGVGEGRVRLTPLFLLILLSVGLFFYLTYHSFTSAPSPRIRPGESIAI